MGERRIDQPTPLAEVTSRLNEAAQIVGTWDLAARVGIILPTFGGYPGQILLGDNELENLALETGAETNADSADVLRLDRWGKDSLWRQEKFGDGYRPVSEVGSAEQLQGTNDIIWVLTDKEDGGGAIAASAPDGTNGYWLCGPEVSLLGNQIDQSDKPRFVLQPVQYFTAEERDYGTRGEFYLIHARLGVARHPSTQIPLLEALEEEGVDSTKFAHHLPAGTTRAVYLARTAVLRQSHNVLDEAVAVAQATERGKGAKNPNQALRKVAKIAVDFDLERAVEIAQSIEDDGVAVKTLTEIGLGQQNRNLLTEARERIAAKPRGNRQEDQIWELFRATYRADAEFAQSLFEDMLQTDAERPKSLLAKHQAQQEDAQLESDVVLSTELLGRLNPERLGKIALLLAEQHRETGDTELIAAALSVAGVIGELEARQATLGNVAAVMATSDKSRRQ